MFSARLPNSMLSLDFDFLCTIHYLRESLFWCLLSLF
jgi:hypothetical protein